MHTLNKYIVIIIFKSQVVPGTMSISDSDPHCRYLGHLCAQPAFRFYWDLGSAWSNSLKLKCGVGNYLTPTNRGILGHSYSPGYGKADAEGSPEPAVSGQPRKQLYVFKNCIAGREDLAQLIGCFPSKHEALGSFPILYEVGTQPIPIIPTLGT